MKVMRNWAVKRSGPTMTIRGDWDGGANAVLTGVGTVAPEQVDGYWRIIATTEGGEKVQLAIPS